MCFNVSIAEMTGYLEQRFDARFMDPNIYQPIYHVSAFSTPMYPVISAEEPEKIQYYRWGLIPFWVKDEATAHKIRFRTFNAKAETIHEKPSFRTAVKDKRCLVLVDGFYEWREVAGIKFPYHIKLVNEKAFALAGIWDMWENKKTGEKIRSFSIITTDANELLAKIHNTKKRMPVILRPEDEKRWLGAGLDNSEIDSFLKPYKSSEMEGYPVSKLISQKGAHTNVPEIKKKVEYEELKQTQTTFF